MKELIASLLLSFFIAETAQAVIVEYIELDNIQSHLKSIESDLE
ncbi:hypothetical protein [Halobacteriovorax sp. HLS]|nr:hypothetical protein [Halobacteriovorax sp. HLS]